MGKYCNACELWELFIRKALGFFVIIVGVGGLWGALPHFISRHARPFLELGLPEGLVEFGLGATPFIAILLGVALLVDGARCLSTMVLGGLSILLFVSHFFFFTGNFAFPLGIAVICLLLVILQLRSSNSCEW